MSEFATLLQNFLYVLTALALAYTGYGVFERYMDKQEKKEVLKSIADAHNTAVSSMMAIHSISKTGEAVEKSEKKEAQSAPAK